MPVRSDAETDTAVAHDNAKASEAAAANVENDANDHMSDGAESSKTSADDAGVDKDSEDGEPAKAKRRVNWSRMLVFGIVPAVALLLAMAAAFLKWQDSSMRVSEMARIESVQAAKDATVALLSYQPDTVEKDLGAAGGRTTGTFKDEYAKLTHDVVIPGAKEKRISTTAQVQAVASVSAAPRHAVVLVFVNQTTSMGTSAPTDLQSSVRVTMDKIDNRWLIAGFDPV